jgi:Protein of unknown function (DUF3891)
LYQDVRMVLVDHPEGKVAVAQPAHAWISGQLARAWAEVSPREEVCLAAEQHDIPWLEWERDPSYDPQTGYPHTFMSLDMPAKLAMWESGPDLLLGQSRYAALLVSMHGSRLYKDLDRSAVEHEIRATLDASDAEIERNSRLIATWDGMSLALLLGWRPWEDDGVRMQEDGRVEPWPFVTPSLTVRTEGRLLRGPNTALTDAPWVELSYELRQ